MVMQWMVKVLPAVIFGKKLEVFKRFGLSSIIGILVIGIGTLSFELLMHGPNDLFASMFAYILPFVDSQVWGDNLAYWINGFISINLNFVLNTRFTWKHVKVNKWRACKQFNASAFGILAVSAVLFWVLQYTPLAPYYQLNRLLIMGLMFFVNFARNEFWIYKEK